MKRLALLAMLALSHTGPAAADTLPGYDRFDLTADHRARPIAASIWYPAANPTYRAPVGDGPIFDATFAFIGPAIAEGEHPLVLLSHGSGGNADSLGWLTSGLVANGAIVLAVNHPGSTSGDSSPRRSVDLEARANDLTAALDMILADPAFAPYIDADRIGVVGFSWAGQRRLAWRVSASMVQLKIQTARLVPRLQIARSFTWAASVSMTIPGSKRMRATRVSRKP